MLIATLLASTCALGIPDLDADFEAVLGRAGLTTATARLDDNLMRMFRQGEFTTPLYHAASENPWRLPFLADVYRRQFTAAAGRPHESLQVAAQWLGLGGRRTLVGDPLAGVRGRAEAGGLEGALAELRRLGVLMGPDPNLTGVPRETRQATALVLLTLAETVRFRRAAFAGLGDLTPHFEAVAGQTAEPGDPEGFAASLARFRAVDLKMLFAGGHDLTLAAVEARELLAPVLPTDRYDVTLDTRWGKIRLSGGRDTTYDDGPYLLIIDTGGDDTYLNAPATLSPANWASIVIDTHGDDRYLSDMDLAETPIAAWESRRSRTRLPGPGGALFGYSVLVDSAGNDLYRSHRPGLGSGRFGFAVLLDQAGDDVYEAYIDAQGFGHFGMGLLEDLRGHDRYYGFNQVQGVGLTQGVGMLVDRSGNDVYVANESVIDFPSAQSADHNVSMAQGAGNGLRADFSHGHSLAGGIGLLFDATGNDEYRCGVFGQGVGYWMGVGFLWDGEGDDQYHGQWYVQGASAHFAIGYLEDLAGNDRYTALMNMAQGAGHDFSVGMLIDRAGNDAYIAPNLSLGAGNANGIGIFVDVAGDDTYESRGTSLGMGAAAVSGSLRARALCLGVFMDLGGQDTYPAFATWAANNQARVNWTDRRASPAESQLGIFFDR